jgi:hypothetical protein
MKTSIAAAVLAMVAANNGYAEQHTVEGAYTSDNSHSNSATVHADSATSPTTSGGYRLLKYFALEKRSSNLGQYTPGTSNDTVKTDFAALTGNAVGILPFGESGFELYGHFGAGMISRKGNTAFPVPEDNENGTVGTAGLGLRYISSSFNALSFSAGYDTYMFQAADNYSDKSYDQSVNMAKLGLQYHF